MTAQATRPAPAAPTAEGAVATLERARERVDPALRSAVARLDPHTRLVTSYHLGWCDNEGRPLEGNGGKAIRPALALLVGESVCGDPEPALPGAVAVELVHNFSLVHDDLMDRDAERRHRATVWSVWGDTTAVLVGDAMLSLAHEVLADSGSAHAAAASRITATATRELIRGQSLDVAFEDRDPVADPVPLAECVDMAAGKTGALLAVSAEIGALLSGARAETCAAYRHFGAELGMAFQLVDDLLGIWGWPERTGKPVFSDLRSRKKTLPVVWALANGGEPGRDLAAWLRTSAADGEADSEQELRHAASLLDRAGARAWVIDEARRRVRAGLAALEAVGLDGPARGRFTDLANFVVEREL